MKNLNVIGFSTLTVSTSAVGFADASPALTNGTINSKDVHRFMMTLETDLIRWRTDGTDPDSTTGHVVIPTDRLVFTDQDYTDLIAKSNFIRDTNATNDATLVITWFD